MIFGWVEVVLEGVEFALGVVFFSGERCEAARCGEERDSARFFLFFLMFFFVCFSVCFSVGG